MLADGSEYRGHYALDDAALAEFHRPRLRVLADAGADILACETIPNLREARVLAHLLEEFPGVCAWISFSVQGRRAQWPRRGDRRLRRGAGILPASRRGRRELYRAAIHHPAIAAHAPQQRQAAAGLSQFRRDLRCGIETLAPRRPVAGRSRHSQRRRANGKGRSTIDRRLLPHRACGHSRLETMHPIRTFRLTACLMVVVAPAAGNAPAAGVAPATDVAPAAAVANPAPGASCTKDTAMVLEVQGGTVCVSVDDRGLPLQRPLLRDWDRRLARIVAGYSAGFQRRVLCCVSRPRRATVCTAGAPPMTPGSSSK